jgi:hypothetical protein
MTDFDELTPAPGVVEFSIWHVVLPDGSRDIDIEGSAIWRRPVTGLIGDDARDPVIRDERNLPLRASEYLDKVLPPDLQPEHCAVVYRSEIDGPLGAAPTVRLFGSRSSGS